MGWIVGIGVLVLFIFLFANYSRFRKAIGFIVLFIAAAYFYFEIEESNKKDLIKKSDLEITQIWYDRKWNDLHAKIKNNSRYTLKRVEFKVYAKDCPKDGACEIVGEDDASDIVNIPPGQSRAFKGYVTFSNMPYVKNFRWSAELVEIRAK